MCKKSLLLFLFFGTVALSQDFSISGIIVDENNAPLSFVNVILYEEETKEAVTGTSSDEKGAFVIESLNPSVYTVEISMIGFKTKSITVTLSENTSLGSVSLEEDREQLNEAVVTAKRPTIEKNAGTLIFNVENTSLSNGNTLDLLSKTPGVLVIGDNIRIKNQNTTIYLNGRRVYLSSQETVSFLQNLDASAIKKVEVITNPSSQFDAESGTVLNIITSKNVSPGYKGSFNGTYEQAIFSKYTLGTSHFFKNNWLNLYAGYSFSPRKENKDQDSYIRFFEADEMTTSAIWESDFNRITKSYGHQGNVVADIDFDSKNSLNLTANIFLSPNKNFKNGQHTTIRNAQRQIDSTFFTNSTITNDLSNIAIGTEYKTLLNDAGSELKIGGNYIAYVSDQFQELKSNYFLPNGDFLKSIAFETNSTQDTKIATGYIDFNSTLFSGTLETGLKYANIDTQTGLDYFTLINGTPEINIGLSDDFNYEESIFAGYVTFSKEFEKWNFSAGTRAEYTDVQGISLSLGNVNTQNYFKLFPSASIEYQLNENNSLGINYARKIERPRYQSLNPFRYFLNENNFNEGNPNLVPSIEDKITLSYSHKGKWFFELYYQTIENSLEILNFQDNETFTFRQLDANLIDFFQYSFDAVYAAPIGNFWYASFVTSTYYLENEFFAVESISQRAKNHTMGVFVQAYNQITFSQKGGFTSDVSARYISNLISGSLDYKNIFDFSVSFRKSLWNKRASLSAGVDDIFKTNNVQVASRYLNQDNSYFAQPESRKFWIGFKYNFGNYILRENKKTITNKEGDRLNKP
ncbi:MAG: TonB-dependent receptor [Flavobacteriaceae bacterium]|nr:TonB-dependent receptor [Flavobacteriaceae bacterium]